MTLPTGTISMSDVNTELGYSSTALISLNDTAVRNLANVPSGQISMSDLQGKGGTFYATYSSTTSTGFNLRTWALANGWNGTAAATITISSGVYVQSSSTSTAALTIDGSWPGGVTLINNGFITGRGGDGGMAVTLYGAAGSPGGPAISLGVNCAIQIGSTGTIMGGGGGGGTAYGGGGGGAGGGTGGTSYSGSYSGGGSGGYAGSNGNNGANQTPGITFGQGAGGGSGLTGFPASPSTISGGAGGIKSYGLGGASGGGGGGSSTYNSDGGNGGSTSSGGGGTVGAAGVNGGGGGGGGFGKAGGDGVDSAGTHFAGGAAGKAIALNGYTVTLSGSTSNVWGAVS